MVLDSDHCIGDFTMLMSLHAEFHDNQKSPCLDEVVGAIKIPKDGVETLHCLAIKLSQGFLYHSIGKKLFFLK